MIIDQQSLNQIVIDICQSMLRLELTLTTLDVDLTRQLVASVQIRGTRHSIIEVFAHDDLMASIAEVMFNDNRQSLSQADIQDAFCEVANMIGGNVKGCFGEEGDLSLPVIGPAHSMSEQLPDGSLCSTFECCGYPLTVIMRELIDVPLSTTSAPIAHAIDCSDDKAAETSNLA